MWFGELYDIRKYWRGGWAGKFKFNKYRAGFMVLQPVQWPRVLYSGKETHWTQGSVLYGFCLGSLRILSPICILYVKCNGTVEHVPGDSAYWLKCGHTSCSQPCPQIIFARGLVRNVAGSAFSHPPFHLWLTAPRPPPPPCVHCGVDTGEEHRHNQEGALGLREASSG